MNPRGQNLDTDISDVIVRINEDKVNHLRSDFLTESRHFDTKVSVPSSDDMVVHHGHAFLNIFEQIRGLRLVEASSIHGESYEHLW